MRVVSDLRMRCAAYIWKSHPAARLLVGIIFLGTALRSASIPHALTLLGAVLLLLLALGTPAATVFRALKVLAFLVLPILILHLWLTPGRYLIWGISAEGLERGGWLSLHLVLMYFSAMLFSRLVSLREWMALTSVCGGRRLQPYLLLLMPLARQVRWRTQALAQQWRRRGTWRELARTLSAVVAQCMSASRSQADALWLRWPASVGDSSRSFFSMTTSGQAWPATLLMLLVGAAILAASVGGR